MNIYNNHYFLEEKTPFSIYYKILNTIFYKDEDSKIDLIDLDYNDEQCTKLIKEEKKKINKTIASRMHWYADFEADVSTSIHKPYICVEHRAIGNHKGEDCAKKL